MKKIFLAPILLVSIQLLLSYTLVAQNALDKKTKFGVAFGPNVTKASLSSHIPSVPAYSRYTENHSDVGFHVKGFVSLQMSKHFFFQPELGFSLTKQKQVYCNDYLLNNTGSISFTDKLTASAIMVNGLLKYKTKYFSINAGPQAGMLIGANIHSTDRSNGYSNIYYDEKKIDFTKDSKTHIPVVSLLVGLTREYIFQHWGAGVYYNLGLSNNTEYYNMNQIGKIKGFSMQFSYTLN